jgi:hypothetical protein
MGRPLNLDSLPRLILTRKDSGIGWNNHLLVRSVFRFFLCLWESFPFGYKLVVFPAFITFSKIYRKTNDPSQAHDTSAYAASYDWRFRWFPERSNGWARHVVWAESTYPCKEAASEDDAAGGMS